MFKTETINQVAKLLKLDPVKFAEDLKKTEEVELTIPVLQVFTAEELTTRISNEVAPAKTASYAEGKTAGLEMKVKEWKTRFGIDGEGKDPDEFITKYKEKIVQETGKEPTAKVKELETTVQTLQTNLETEKTTHQAEVDRLKKDIDQTKIHATIDGFIPATLPKGITRQDAAVILRNNITFEYDDGGQMIAKRDGKPIQDPVTLKPIEPSKVVIDFVKERSWDVQQQRQGRGDGDDTGGDGQIDVAGIKNIETFRKHLKDNKINENSTAAIEVLKKLTPDIQKEITGIAV